jgi:hypothetical protein
MRGGPATLTHAAAAVLVAGDALWWGGRREASPPAGSPPASIEPPAKADAASPVPLASKRGAAKEPPGGAGSAEADPLAELEASEGSWAAVDLEAVRAAMPDNIYWRMSAPTRDPEVQRQREEERARWNVEYGKVLSNTATAAEVDAYYAHRQRLSLDYVQFASFVLGKYEKQLPPRDVALLRLAMELHLARLEEIPRQITEAQQRREEHDATRRAWLEEQKAYGEDPAAPR